MQLEPTVIPGFVGIEVVENDMDGGVGPSCYDVVHEVEELDTAPPLLVSCRHLSGSHLEGGEQRRGTVALVIVAMTAQRSAVRHFQIALCPLKRLDRGLFIDADDNRVLRRSHVEPDHVSRLGSELRIVALAPGFAPGKVDFLGTQKAPNN